MAGIYIHIPFCKKACHYCNFHFSTQTEYIPAFTQSLLDEIELQKYYLQEPIETLYFGGGTPSLLSIKELKLIVQSIKKHYKLNHEIEFTLEVNPDDVTETMAESWLAVGVNRLSMGIQSFQAHALEWMNRVHSLQQAHQAIQIVKKVGFKNISADLIYGTPHVRDDELKADIDQLLDNNINHISCYALTVEEKTALFSMIEKNKIDAIDIPQQARQFDIVVNKLEAAGFEHYEISNFAMPGFRSKHNSNYWNQIPYLGLGPSAHSYNRQQRQWNIANNQLYIQSIKNRVVPFEIENLTLAQQFNEYMMISLRKSEGFSMSYIKTFFGETFWEHCQPLIKKFEKLNYIKATQDGFTLQKEAKFLADGIACDFFWMEGSC